MKVLLVGSGGREHALAWKIAQSELVSQIFVAPGNAGTATESKCTNVDTQAEDLDGLLAFAKSEEIGLTVIGPEVPLVAGIVDQFTAAGLKCFGPSKGAAQLEGSKAYTKDFLSKYHIPTAAYGNFTQIDEAVTFIKTHGAPIVVKADGLAAGKGVIIAQTIEEAIAAVEDMLAGNAFGDAGHRVVVEEFLEGEEASFIVMVDGEHILPMASSQDHKARDDGDSGPNTGGMGAYSPAPIVDQVMHDRIMETVIKPTVKGMQSEGFPFTGFLYAGVMINDDGIPKVLEFNVRFGDPETQPIMMRLKSDLVEAMLAAIDGKLNEIEASWDDRAALGVVMAASGYPESYKKGMVISGLEQCSDDDCKVFHAGTDNNEARIVTSGGRVLCVTALGDTVTAAQQAAYAGVNAIKWDNCYFRNDIGHRAIAREKNS